jgi:hypothetical protein
VEEHIRLRLLGCHHHPPAAAAFETALPWGYYAAGDESPFGRFVRAMAIPRQLVQGAAQIRFLLTWLGLN